MNEEYEGYSNWETWNISLWLNNDETMYNEALRICRENNKSLYLPAHSITPQYNAVKMLEEYVFDLLDDKTISDKISIHRVDFKQIAKEFQQTLKELRRIPEN
tara:strand:- start:91 stop:399 length:309 start_codon:yes stop_codon:yes gene_type:complete